VQVIVIPPLSEANQPVLSDTAKGMLKHYMGSGHNTLIVCGGPANIDFINKNLLTSDGGQLLEPAWTRFALLGGAVGVGVGWWGRALEWGLPVRSVALGWWYSV